MAITRTEAERELLKLLNRALATVPFVRLDKVDEVIEKFKIACSLLEENLNDDVDLSAEEDDGADESLVQIPRSMPLGDESPDAGSDTEEETDEDRKEQEKLQREREEKRREEELKKSQGAIRPIANKADPVRKDYSSPDIKSRGLRGSISEAAPTRPSSRATTTTTGQVLAAAATKPSSRARGDDATEKDKQAKQGSSGVGLKGASSRAAGKSGVLRDALLRSASARNVVGGDGDVQVSKERFTKDDGTPRLGARKLRAAAQGAKSPPEGGPKGDFNTAVLAKDPSPPADTDAGANEPLEPSKKKPAGTTSALLPASTSAPITNPLSPEGKDARIGKPLPADLIPSKPKNHQVRIEQSLEAPPSPAQFNSHRHLLKIAGKAEPAPPSKLGPIPSSEEVIKITERPIESPKPGFLRRLDSPLTNHGKLLQHKARLNKMLRRAIRAVPHIKVDNYPTVKQSFMSALDLLESSTTTALAKKDPAVA